MKKVIIFIPFLQHYRIDFYNYLSQYFDVTVVVPSKKENDGRELVCGKDKNLFKLRELGTVIFKFWIFRLEWQELCLKDVQRNDVIIIMANPGVISYYLIAMVGRFLKKRVIFWTCDWTNPKHNFLSSGLRSTAKFFFYRLPNVHILYSSEALRNLKNLGISSSKMVLNVNTYEHEIVNRNFSLKNELTFLYVGSISKEKRVALLLQAFLESKWSHSTLRIIGDGPLKNNLEDKYKLHENIIFEGAIKNPIKSFRSTDVFILPGSGGLALIDAVAAGALCIVSRADGTEVDLIVDKYSGLRFESGSVRSLVSVLNSIEPHQIGYLVQNAQNILRDRFRYDKWKSVFLEALTHEEV